MKDPEMIAVDLDATLAEHHGWKGKDHIGPPVPAMLKRVKDWIAQGKKVIIHTARADRPENIPPIRKWLKEHVGQELTVTNKKLPAISRFYDDRAVQVERNTGRLIGSKQGRARRMAA